MRNALVVSALVMAACTGAFAAPADSPVYTDPAAAAADADLAFQGEYEGVVKYGAGETKYGVQVIAQGGGHFAAVAYPGGLPGAGHRARCCGARTET